jgi:hypothetical protein
MMQVIVVRHVPEEQIGMCGRVPHHAFEQFEHELDTLEMSGAVVERLAGDENNPALPLVRVNGALLSSGRYPSRREWVRAIGAARRAEHAAGFAAHAA